MTANSGDQLTCRSYEQWMHVWSPYGVKHRRGKWRPRRMICGKWTQGGDRRTPRETPRISMGAKRICVEDQTHQSSV